MKHNLQTLKQLTVLLAEDDGAVLDEMSKMLSIFFREVFQASNGQDALNLYEAKKPDIVLSDIQMPISDGLSLAQRIRSSDYTTPILLISSYSECSVLIKALNSGVDGYILKPIELDGVLEAIANSLKRAGKTEGGIIRFQNGLLYNEATKELMHNGLPVDLGIKEHALFALLLHNRGRTVTKQEIAEEIWAMDEMTDGALKSVLTRLRRKIGEECIVNVKHSGWRLSLD